LELATAVKLILNYRTEHTHIVDLIMLHDPIFALASP